MDITIQLSAVEQARLETAARQAGIAPVEIMHRLLDTHLPDVERSVLTASQTQEQARRAAIQSARGSMAHIAVSIEDLHRERQFDREREERQIMEAEA